MLDVLLVGHSFVGRYARRADRNYQTLAEAAGVHHISRLAAISFAGTTFDGILRPPASLLTRLRALPQVPDIIVVDLGTNDLCPVAATVSCVIDKAMALIDLLRQSHLLPQQPVFLGVV